MLHVVEFDSFSHCSSRTASENVQQAVKRHSSMSEQTQRILDFAFYKTTINKTKKKKHSDNAKQTFKLSVCVSPHAFDASSRGILPFIENNL
jgi:hypothetical protein